MSEQSRSLTAKDKKRFCHRASALLATLTISLFFSLIFEWIGIALVWNEEGHRHSQQMMVSEMLWLSENLTLPIFNHTPLELAQSVIRFVHYWLFEITGLSQWLSNPQAMGNWEYWIYHNARAYIEAIIYVVITFIIRLFIIIFTSPLFFLTAIAGLTEGLMLRDLRKFGAGRESSFLYHKARRWIMPIMIGTWIIYLSIPFSIYPIFIIAPAATLFGLSICITAASFKKYL
ncbi:TIGR03747 family integrating conjugative element membrane protein [Caviibacterium pharyngocola]|uniref:TIGR03747 family integrating conjugative element membrane protein n=1 Tax=Caviibacterium pharyngocola TaxID=28159 RepID=A0A2M8RV75_9PAST|nr:TIGR03747 family integrating conjugative element membrane protein [Caviibacterium pharyngocola]PJG82775.1 TIGR03747 family integrating conjugative element membrane protein [Caviibacterium pharyngocola]